MAKELPDTTDTRQRFDNLAIKALNDARTTTRRTRPRRVFVFRDTVRDATTGVVLLASPVWRALCTGEYDATILFDERPSEVRDFVWCRASVQIGDVLVTASEETLIPEKSPTLALARFTPPTKGR